MSSFEVGGTVVRIDDETLREIPEDPAAMSAWCAAHPSDPRTVAYLRMLGRLDEAACAGRAALEQPGLSPISRAVRRARYATVLQWQGAHAPAQEQLDLAAEETGLEDPTSPSSLQVLAAVFQHRAKVRFEHAQRLHAEGAPVRACRLWQEAVEDAQRALGLRERLGVTEEGVLASSRQTLARLQRYDLGRADADT